MHLIRTHGVNFLKKTYVPNFPASLRIRYVYVRDVTPPFPLRIRESSHTGSAPKRGQMTTIPVYVYGTATNG